MNTRFVSSHSYGSGALRDSHHVGDIFFKTLLELAEKTAVPIIMITALDVTLAPKSDVHHFHFMVPSQQEYLLGKHDFLRK